MHEFLLELGYPALFLLSFLASTLVPLGSEWLVVALVVAGFTPSAVVLVATVGNVLGAATSYWIGLCGSTFLATRILRMDEQALRLAEARFARYGSWGLLLSWLPVVGDPLCLVAGMLRVPLLRFFLLVLAGKAARYAVVAWATVEGRQLLF